MREPEAVITIEARQSPRGKQIHRPHSRLGVGDPERGAMTPLTPIDSSRCACMQRVTSRERLGELRATEFVRGRPLRLQHGTGLR